VFLVTVELLRAANPLLDLAAADAGVVGAAGLATVIFAAPALVGLLVAAAGPARATLAAVAGLVLLRLVAQVQGPPGLLVVGAGAAAGIAGLVLAVRHAVLAGSGGSATVGVLVGTVADLAVRAAYGSWDPIARPGVLPWLVTLAACAATVAALVAARPAGPPAGSGTPPLPAGTSSLGVGALGPYLALYAMAYGSAPVLAAHAGVSLPAASAVLIAVAVAGMELVRRSWPPAAGAVAGLAAAGGIAAGYWLTGPAALAGVVVTGLSAAVLLARALTPSPAAVPAGGVPPGPRPLPAARGPRRLAGSPPPGSGPVSATCCRCWSTRSTTTSSSRSTTGSRWWPPPGCSAWPARGAGRRRPRAGAFPTSRPARPGPAGSSGRRPCPGRRRWPYWSRWARR
jgi:hypothetical protein